jgi:3-deoxy-D-manno-octulosonic acid kinase
MTPKILQNGKSTILYDADRLGNAAALSFDRNELVSRGSILGAAEGRGTTLFIEHDGQDIALRHYHRGGFVSRFLEDDYLWLGLGRSRAWREWYLLARLYQQGLPVPAPLAARVIRHGLLYTADIMTLRIPQAQPVSQLLMQQSLTEQAWRSIGACIARFHQQGVYHADLNANNILLDHEQQVFIIDFDRGEIRKPAARWQQANLERLLRSLNKFKNKMENFYFSESDWQNLLAGYQA